MILTVENAIIERLSKGLGSSVREVGSYRGELDKESLNVTVRTLPALYVSFAGHKGIKPAETRGERLKVPATFIVYVLTRNVASEAAGRTGTDVEVGAYQLIEAVRVLLARQNLGLEIERLKPVDVTLLGSIKVSAQGLTAYGCSFETFWHERLDVREGFPQFDNPVFAGLDGERVEEIPDLLRVGLQHDLHADGSIDVVDVVNLRKVDNG